MNDEAANRYVKLIMDALPECKTKDQRERAIRLVVKEVERDTRHLAVNVIQRAAN